MNKSERFDNLIAPLALYLGNTAMLIELAALTGIVIAVWFGLRRLRQRLVSVQGRHERLTDNDWHRLILPATLLLLVLISRALLAPWQNVYLFNLAVPLLLSFLGIQSCFYVLRRVFPRTPAMLTVERLVSWLIWGVFALHLSSYLDDVVKALDAVGFDVGRQHLSIYTVLTGLLSLAATLMLALWLGHSVERWLLSPSNGSTPLTGNMRLALTKLARSVLVVMAVLIALPLVGIDITVLSVFGGALGVGLGLGLQKIAANYVSGFTLLLDQSIRIGDMVEVNQHTGVVKEIATRYTVLRSLNGSESIIPNETMITMPVINHSLTDKDNQILLPIQVAYASDLERVRALLLEIAAGHERVLVSHEPQVRLKNFGDNGIDLELVIWIADPEEGEMNLRSDLNWQIWAAFKREKIEIPYPQRVVHQVEAQR
ncbi:MAG: mechanosensitive ion channel [Pseudomonadota bacterium]|nr:mechanosensitive ion channel [Pseudomonadota bacterium]